MSAYHFKYFQNIPFENHGIAPTPPDLPTLKVYPTPGVGGRFGILMGKDELEGTRSNFTPWLCDFEHQGENRWGVGTTPLRRTRVKQKRNVQIITIINATYLQKDFLDFKLQLSSYWNKYQIFKFKRDYRQMISDCTDTTALKSSKIALEVQQTENGNKSSASSNLWTSK